MTVYGGAARDLLRNLPAISEHFEVRFLCLNLRDSQRNLIEAMGIEVLVNLWDVTHYNRLCQQVGIEAMCIEAM